MAPVYLFNLILQTLKYLYDKVTTKAQPFTTISVETKIKKEHMKSLINDTLNIFAQGSKSID